MAIPLQILSLQLLLICALLAQEEFKDVLAWWKELLGAAVGQVNSLS